MEKRNIEAAIKALKENEQKEFYLINENVYYKTLSPKDKKEFLKKRKERFLNFIKPINEKA